MDQTGEILLSPFCTLPPFDMTKSTRAERNAEERGSRRSRFSSIHAPLPHLHPPPVWSPVSHRTGDGVNGGWRSRAFWEKVILDVPEEVNLKQNSRILHPRLPSRCQTFQLHLGHVWARPTCTGPGAGAGPRPAGVKSQMSTSVNLQISVKHTDPAGRGSAH